MTRRSPSSPDRRTPHPSTPREKDLRKAESLLARRVVERDQLFEEARTVRRASQDAMRRLHAGEDPSRELRRLAPRAQRLQRGGHAVDTLVLDALQEYAEARLLEAVVNDEPLPSSDELQVPVEAYLAGLGDLVGEVRRLTVAALGDERLAEAEGLLGLMDALLHALLRFEAPRGIIALKPKQDVARLLVERSRGELALAKVLRRAARAAGAQEQRLVSEGLKATEGLDGP